MPIYNANRGRCTGRRQSAVLLYRSGFLSTICVRGGKINDIIERLLLLPKDTKFENVILQVGSNDCCVEFDSEIFCENYTPPVTIASAICNTVVISGFMSSIR